MLDTRDWCAVENQDWRSLPKHEDRSETYHGSQKILPLFGELNTTTHVKLSHGLVRLTETPTELVERLVLAQVNIIHMKARRHEIQDLQSKWWKRGMGVQLLAFLESICCSRTPYFGFDGLRCQFYSFTRFSKLEESSVAIISYDQLTYFSA